jgi:hypothetical protein
MNSSQQQILIVGGLDLAKGLGPGELLLYVMFGEL